MNDEEKYFQPVDVYEFLGEGIMTIYLIRHGQTDYNRDKLMQGQSDIPLNEQGRNESENLGIFLQKHFDPSLLNNLSIYSSDLQRCKETATIVMDKIYEKKKNKEYTIKYDKLLRELHFGVYQHKKSKKFEDYFESKKFEVDEKIKGGESLNELRNRIEKFLKKICKENNDKNNLFVFLHGGSIRCLLSILLKLDLKLVYKTFKSHNCSISKISVNKENSKLAIFEYMNFVPNIKFL